MGDRNKMRVRSQNWRKARKLKEEDTERIPTKYGSRLGVERTDQPWYSPMFSPMHLGGRYLIPRRREENGIPHDLNTYIQNPHAHARTCTHALQGSMAAGE